MDRTLKLYSLRFSDVKTYAFAALFIIGNLLLPQLCHLTDTGGTTWLPVYFFTLIGAYKYGIRVGVLTAVASPLTNYLLFGMPPEGALAGIVIKSLFLAVIAGFVAYKFKKITLPLILAVVAGYQIPGIFTEWVILKNVYLAVQDFRIGLPGIILQVIGGYLFLKITAGR